MNYTFQPQSSFNGSAYTASLLLNNLTLYDMTQPFQVFKGSQQILGFDQTGIVISGDFTVTGTLTTNTTIVNTYAGGMLHLGSGNTGDSIDLGFYAEYINGSPVYTGFVRDSSDVRKTWALFGGYTTEPTTVVNGGNPIADANLDNLKLNSIAAVAGSVSMPAFAFTTALTTGMYLDSGTTIGFANGGSAGLLISATALSTSRLITSTGTADAASAADATASISTTGGAAISKTLWAASLKGVSASISGALTAGSAVFGSVISTTGAINSLSVSATLSTAAITTQTLTTSSTATLAALVVSGSTTLSSLTSGAGTFGGTLTANAATILNGATTVNNSLTSQSLVTGNLSASGTVTITGAVNVNSLTVSNLFTPFRVSTTSTSTSSSSTDTAASLSVAGGASIAANMNIGGNVLISGNLFVSGSTISTQGSNKITGLETGTTVTLNINKCAVECNNSGAITVNLPAFSVTYKGKEYYILKTNTSSTVTISPNGTDLLNGVNSNIGPLGAGDRMNIYILGGETGWFTI